MRLSSEKDIKNLLKKYRIKPSKKLGQNFLIDRAAVKKIISAADLKPEDVVLEIGPGIGVLTQELAKKAKRVIAVEKDKKMIEILGNTLKGFDNVKIIQGDIRMSDFPNINDRKSDIHQYKVVGNLPFYLTAPVIRQFLEPKTAEVSPRPTEMVLVVQKEVGQRICAKPPRMSILAVSVQVYADPKIVSYISKKSFWPQPKIDAAIIKITPFPKRSRSHLDQINLGRFFEVVKAGFSQPRKQLINNLVKKLNLSREKTEKWLLKNNIKPTQRAETLSVKDWINLTKTSKIN
jgi:16S rRNA (adenine1518-N6/adenine1519-N6)-dimethyltransferase